MLCAPNAPQAGFVDGLNLFEVGLAFAREFRGMGWHPYSGENLPVLQFAQIRGACADWKMGAICRKFLLWTSQVWLRTTAGDLSRTPFQSVARSRAANGCGDDGGLLAVLLALFVHQFSPARIGRFEKEWGTVLQQS